VVGDRGSGSNAFSLFLIFILLYFSQKGAATPGASSPSSVPQEDHQGHSEETAENKLAVGLDYGNAVEYQQDTAAQSSQEFSNQLEELEEVPVPVESTEEIPAIFEPEVKPAAPIVKTGESEEKEETVPDLPEVPKVEEEIPLPAETTGTGDKTETAGEVEFATGENPVQPEPQVQKPWHLHSKISEGTKKKQSGPKISITFGSK